MSVLDDGGEVCRVIGKVVDFQNEKNKLLIAEEKNTVDTMTGVYNKQRTKENIDEILNATDSRRVLALLMIDMDDFKSINDNFGHMAGDAVLMKVANVLVNTFGEDAIVGRFGGDEFVVFVNAVDKAEVVKNIEKFYSQLSADSDIEINCSTGVAISHDEDNFNSLFVKADEAMYEAKRFGKNGYKIKG